ncbi:MAG TPA: DUF366 family protein [Planctomycetota bacterium]|nr:DUF366 family protein [Planctomycetota bacterium]
MKVRWLSRRLAYDGSQLRAHWILTATGLVGDALVAFRGPCVLPPAEFADLEDRLAGATIAADDMLHFVCERFDDGDLDRVTLRQRLLAARLFEVLCRLAPGKARRLRRDGDDLWLGAGKLSVSVATRSAVSSLIHLGVNVVNRGTPVRTASLADLGLAPQRVAREVLRATEREEEGIAHARCKVRVRIEA